MLQTTTHKTFDSAFASSQVRFGRGWYATEVYAGSTFRWAKSGAELFVTTPCPLKYSLTLVVEPGPGVGLKPFDLSLWCDAETLSTLRVNGKEQVKIDLPGGLPAVHRLILRATDAGRLSPNDPRQLDFRIFEVNIEASKPDVVPAHMRIGANWYPIEEHNGTRFRWVNNGAEILIRNPYGVEYLPLEVEPGPAIANKPFTLQVQQRVGAESKTLSAVEIRHRQRIEVPVPQGDEVCLALHVDVHGKPIGNDSRVLNFRVYEQAVEA